jgi:hypothetical protein
VGILSRKGRELGRNKAGERHMTSEMVERKRRRGCVPKILCWIGRKLRLCSEVGVGHHTKDGREGKHWAQETRRVGAVWDNCSRVVTGVTQCSRSNADWQ